MQFTAGFASAGDEPLVPSTTHFHCAASLGVMEGSELAPGIGSVIANRRQRPDTSLVIVNLRTYFEVQFQLSCVNVPDLKELRLSFPSRQSQSRSPGQSSGLDHAGCPK